MSLIKMTRKSICRGATRKTPISCVRLAVGATLLHFAADSEIAVKHKVLMKLIGALAPLRHRSCRMQISTAAVVTVKNVTVI